MFSILFVICQISLDETVRLYKTLVSLLLLLVLAVPASPTNGNENFRFGTFFLFFSAMGRHKVTLTAFINSIHLD